jgi:hypothetical protein
MRYAVRVERPLEKLQWRTGTNAQESHDDAVASVANWTYSKMNARSHKCVRRIVKDAHYMLELGQKDQ